MHRVAILDSGALAQPASADGQQLRRARAAGRLQQWWRRCRLREQWLLLVEDTRGHRGVQILRATATLQRWARRRRLIEQWLLLIEEIISFIGKTLSTWPQIHTGTPLGSDVPDAFSSVAEEAPAAPLPSRLRLAMSLSSVF